MDQWDEAGPRHRGRDVASRRDKHFFNSVQKQCNIILFIIYLFILYIIYYNICKLGWKIPITSQKLIFGIRPQNGEYCINMTPKRDFLARKLVIYDVQNVNNGPPCGLGAIPRKKLKGRPIIRNQKMWQVKRSSRPPPLSQRHTDLHVWSYPRQLFQVLSKSVKTFLLQRVSKCGHSCWLLLLQHKPWQASNVLHVLDMMT